MYSKQGEVGSEKADQKRKNGPGQIGGDRGRRTSQGAGGGRSELENELKAKQTEFEKLRKDSKIRRESESQMKQVSSQI